MSDAPQAKLELDPTAITRVIDATILVTTEIVAFHFNAAGKTDLSKPAEISDTRFRLRGPSLNAVQRRMIHQNWILARAFQDLLRAVRHGLEVAHVIVTLIGATHRTRSDTTVREFLEPFEKQARNLYFPQLLEAVNEKLATKLDFSDSYQSLQTARNCLEHRAGVIGTADTKGTATFEMTIPRMKVFYIREGVEVELEPGHVVEPDKGKTEAEVLMRFEARKRTLQLGEQLSFTLSEFNEITFACWYLGQQLVAKLPTPAIP